MNATDRRLSEHTRRVLIRHPFDLLAYFVGGIAQNLISLPAKLMSIELEDGGTTLRFTILIGVEQHEFTATATTETLGESHIGLLHPDEAFQRTFCRNADLLNKVIRILGRVSKGQPVDLPMDVGYYQTEGENT